MPSSSRRKREKEKELFKESAKCQKLSAFFPKSQKTTTIPNQQEFQSSQQQQKDMPMDTEEHWDDFVNQENSTSFTHDDVDLKLTYEAITETTSKRPLQDFVETPTLNTQECTSDKKELECEIGMHNVDSSDSDNLNKECGINNKGKVKKEGGHKTQFNPDWKDTFPWIKQSVVESKNVLFCTLCIKHHKNCKTYKNSPWVHKGFLTVQLDKVKDHAKCEMHKKAVKLEMVPTTDETKELEKNSEMSQAIEGSMKCLNFLIKNNLPHTTLYEPFINFCIEHYHI